MGYEPLGRIRPVPPSPSLLTSARPLPDVNWSTGIAWATSCVESSVQPFCPGTNRAEGVDRELAYSMPFSIYTPVVCDMPVDGADLEQLVVDATEAHTPAAIATALWMGGSAYDADDTEQVTLRRVATNVSQANPLDLDDGFASLLTHYQLCTGGYGGAVIHMPGTLLTAALGGGNGGARLCWPEGDKYRGPHGCTVVAGPGYPEGFSVDGPNGHGPRYDDAPTELFWGNEPGTAWIYVTGPIEYATTSPVRVLPETERDRTTVRQNKYELWGEREAIVRFDPCCVFALEVWNMTPLPEVS